jgi:hypothetical protein
MPKQIYIYFAFYVALAALGLYIQEWYFDGSSKRDVLAKKESGNKKYKKAHKDEEKDPLIKEETLH